MLAAVLHDFRSVGSDVATLWAEGIDSNAAVEAHRQILTSDHDSVCEQIQRWSRDDGGDPRALLIIAPECDGILDSLLTAAECSWSAALVILNLDSARSRLFSDKLSTFDWLTEHGIPAIPTTPVKYSSAPHIDQFSGSVIASRTTEPRTHVVKPRYGVGSADVQLLTAAELNVVSMVASDPAADWILQPFVPGFACSIGFIGGGDHASAKLLAPVRQNIVESAGRLVYAGGCVPCADDLGNAIISFAPQLVAALGRFHGYVGVDLIVNLNAEQPVVVVEINPRLCTSYVGYRTLAAENLAERFLLRRSEQAVIWKSGCVTFDVDGTVRRDIP